MMPLMTEPAPHRFGTFRGVLRPVLLTLLGALLVLREGWLVGSCGLVGALAVIVFSYLITGTTALAVSTVATNVRVRAGGAFAIIAQALGLEAGGAIGIPLWIAQCASAALYLFAFTEAWAYMFPEHPTAAVVFIAFVLVAGLVWRSARIAFRAQAPLLVIVGLALASAWLGAIWAEPVPEAAQARIETMNLARAFPIFFPAATGIMVGVGMSGDLANPRRSIPRGLLGAWGISLGIYLITAFWYDAVASPTQLVNDPTIMIRMAWVGPMVLIGLLCTTLMAALSCLVAAPRLLQAMGEQRVVPGGEVVGKRSEGGEPRSACLASFAVTALCLCSGSLDALAPLVTSVFLLTYLSIHVVVFVEQQLDMVSFRPSMPLPRSVPTVGILCCSLALVLCSPVAGMAGAALVGGIYLWLYRRQLHTPWATVRSGINVRVASWAARRAVGSGRPERAWTPELMIPVNRAEQAEQISELANRITRRVGSARLVGIGGRELDAPLQEVASRLRASGSHTTATVLDLEDFALGTTVAVDATRGFVSTPNLVLVGGNLHSERDLQVILDHCHRREMGMAVFLPHPEGGIGRGRDVVVWISERSPNWELELHNTNLDLPVLLAYLLTRDGGGEMRLSTVVRDSTQVAAGGEFLDRIVDMGRLPPDSSRLILTGGFIEALRDCPYADVHFLGIATTVDLERLIEMRDAAGGACVFLLDSGQESVLA
jgi:amino acid transporter